VRSVDWGSGTGRRSGASRASRHRRFWPASSSPVSARRAPACYMRARCYYLNTALNSNSMHLVHINSRRVDKHSVLPPPRVPGEKPIARATRQSARASVAPARKLSWAAIMITPRHGIWFIFALDHRIKPVKISCSHSSALPGISPCSTPRLINLDLRSVLVCLQRSPSACRSACLGTTGGFEAGSRGDVWLKARSKGVPPFDRR
jgi:hypothetical protein